MIDCTRFIDKCVHCETEEQANELLKIADPQGFKWSSNSLIECNHYKHYQDETVYHFYADKEVTYGNVNVALKQQKEIIKFSDLKKEKFNKYDIVSFEGHIGMVLGYIGESCVLVLFKERRKALHRASHYKLTNGFETKEKLPDRCWFCDEDELTLEIPHMAKVKINTGDGTIIGQYVSNSDYDLDDLLIQSFNSESQGRFFHNGNAHYTFDGINCSEFTNKKLKCGWTSINDIQFIKEEEMKTKYVAKKTIVGSEIVEYDPCKTEFENFVRQYGYFNSVAWTKEIEDKFEEENGWIEFLINNNFIERNSDKIDYNAYKIYCFRWSTRVYKIAKFQAYEKYSIFSLNDTQGFASISQTPRSWDELLEHLSQEIGESFKLDVFDSIHDAIDYYDL